MEADEVVAVIETDKVNVDIRSPQAGTIKKYFAAEGDTVAVDAQFFEIDTDGKGAAKASDATPKDEKKDDKKVEKKEEPKKEEKTVEKAAAPK